MSLIPSHLDLNTILETGDISLSCLREAYKINKNIFSTNFIFTQAIFYDRVNTVENLLILQSEKDIYSFDYKKKDKFGKTPLLYAISTNNIEIVKLFLHRGIDTLKSDNTPLFYAIYANNLDIIKLLFQYGVDKEMVDIDDNTPFLTACCVGDLNIVLYLIENDVNTEVKDKSGRSALYSAIINKNKELVELLLKYECNIESVDNNGKTAFLKLFENCNFETSYIKFLIENGVNTNVRDNFNRTPLLLCCKYYSDNLELVKMIAENEKNERIEQTKKLDRRESLEQSEKGRMNEQKDSSILLSNFKDIYNRFPLMYCVINGSYDTFKYLIERTHLMGCDGVELLKIACSLKDINIEIIKVLFDKGFRLNY